MSLACLTHRDLCRIEVSDLGLEDRHQLIEVAVLGVLAQCLLELRGGLGLALWLTEAGRVGVRGNRGKKTTGGGTAEAVSGASPWRLLP